MALMEDPGTILYLTARISQHDVERHATFLHLKRDGRAFDIQIVSCVTAVQGAEASRWDEEVGTFFMIATC